jgi:hypothetical protein
MISPLQVLPSVPYAGFTLSGIVVGVIAALIIAVLFGLVTRSKQVWIPGLVFGLLIAYAVSTSGFTL